jgi:hypothetical protein
MIASKLNLKHTTVHQILTQELAMRKVYAEMVPKNLTIERKEVYLHLLEWIQSDRNFFKSVITGDESCIFEYDPETKRESHEWHKSASPRSRKARMSKSKIKSMLICFFNCQGIAHKEFVPQGQTVHVRLSIANSWMLHHNNAPCHTAISVTRIFG